MSTILIVEDEEKLAHLLKDYLQQSQFECHMIHHGDEVLDYVKNQSPDLILLDIMLPGKDGVTLCKEIRNFSQVPIIMCTAKVDEIDRLLGLELGADDYICKPYSPREVVARCKSIFRRIGFNKNNDQFKQETPVSVNEAQMACIVFGQAIELTAVEFKIVSLLANDVGRIYSRQQIMDRAYSDNRVVSDRTMDSHIKKIRKKFAQASPDQELIHSVYGVGYKADW